MKKLFSIICVSMAFTINAYAQLDGARIYWPLPKNTNILAFHLVSGTMNASWNNFNFIQPNVNIQNSLYMVTYTRVQPVFGKTAYWTIMLPAGQLETYSSLPMPGNIQYAKGLADPGISGTINILGAPGMNAKEYMRYDLTTTANFGIKATFPLGEYDADETLNIGSNQYKFKFFLPIVHAFSFWERLVLDVTPSATIVTKNDNAMGSEVEQDPVFIIESHLSRDITKNAFISIDHSYIFGGPATYTDKQTGVEVKKSDEFDTHLLGMTINFQINDHMQIFLTHAQTFNDNEEIFNLQGSLIKAYLTWSWHDYFEKVGDFHGN